MWPFDKKQEEGLNNPRLRALEVAVMDLQADLITLKGAMYKLAGHVGQGKGGYRGYGGPSQSEVEKAMNDLFLARNQQVLEAYGFKKSAVVAEWDPHGTVPGDGPQHGEGDNDQRRGDSQGAGNGEHEPSKGRGSVGQQGGQRDKNPSKERKRTGD